LMGKTLYFLSAIVLTLSGVATTHAQLIPLNPERTGHAATLLPSGKVLVTGGVNESTLLNSALLYDPTTKTFTPTGSMSVARKNHTSTLLPDGRVLITGGEDLNGVPFSTAETYNPATGTFSLTPHPMTDQRTQHTSTLLNNGNVLVVGGQS